jgi:hypothetical protein
MNTGIYTWFRGIVTLIADSFTLFDIAKKRFPLGAATTYNLYEYSVIQWHEGRGIWKEEEQGKEGGERRRGGKRKGKEREGERVREVKQGEGKYIDRRGKERKGRREVGREEEDEDRRWVGERERRMK